MPPGRPVAGRGRSASTEERGATTVLVALVLAVLLITAAFAVDIGMQRVARADMQSLADVVALDLAREMEGRTVSELEAAEESLAEASRDRNQDVINYDGSPPGLSIDWGELDAAGEFVPLSGSASPSAVRVRAETTVGFAFGPIAGVDDGDADRAAVASAETAACFSLGSYAARLDTSSSVLLKGLVEDALGGSLSLDAASYRGIADADISLLDLAAELGVGSVDELLTANVTAADLFVAAADVLTGDGNTADADVLRAIAAHIGAHDISVGRLIDARSGGEAAETATINALDLVTATALVANGTNALSIPDLGVRLPMLGTNLTSSLSIVEKARKACGKKGQATAETSQVALDVDGKLAAATVLGLNVTGGQTNVSVDVASARGLLTDVVCGDATTASPSGEDVQVAKGLVGASVSTSVHVSGSLGSDSGLLGSLLGGLTGLLGTVVRVDVAGDVSLAAGTSDPAGVETAHIRVPVEPTTWGEAYPLGSGELGLDTASVTASPPPNLTIRVYTSVLGIPVLKTDVTASQILQITTNLVGALTSNLVGPLLTAVNTNLLEPLTNLLGIKLGGADVFGEKPVCGNPRLVG
jgi:uncharacterized membrane protein